MHEKEQLERFQYEAARIVTGLTRSVSIDNLMSEIGWLPLSDRRQFQKLVTMYKIVNGILPLTIYVTYCHPLLLKELYTTYEMPKI